MMEGVEDIPGAALSEGIRWDWETFPEYLDALERADMAVDLGTHVPHGSVRTYVMGERGARNEAATAEDIAQDAFLAAHRDWERVGRYDKPGAWVRRVVANLSVSLVRTRVREARALARLKPRSSFIPRLPAEDEEFFSKVWPWTTPTRT